MPRPKTENHTTLLLPDYIEVWVQQFLDDRRSQKLSHHTIRFYTKNLSRFVEYCNAHSFKTIDELTPEFLREFLFMYLEKQGSNVGGQLIYFRTIKAFLRWYFVEIEPDYPNPMLKVKPPKNYVAPLKGVTGEQVKTMLDNCKRVTFAGERDKAVLMLLIDTGVRAQELCDIKLTDVDMVACKIVITHGKGNKARVVFFGRETRRQIRRYQRFSRNGEWLFATQSGDKFVYNSLRQILRRSCDNAHITDVSLHSFRRAFAKNALKSGSDLLSIQRMLGHSDLSILNRYIAQDSDDLREEFNSTVDQLFRK